MIKKPKYFAACELCRLCMGDIKTRVYHNDAQILIVDCETCGKNAPIIILKRHTIFPSKGDLKHIETVVRELFGDNVRFRDKMQKNVNHYHRHLFL